MDIVILLSMLWWSWSSFLPLSYPSLFVSSCTAASFIISPTGRKSSIAQTRDQPKNACSLRSVLATGIVSTIERSGRCRHGFRRLLRSIFPVTSQIPKKYPALPRLPPIYPSLYVQ